MADKNFRYKIKASDSNVFRENLLPYISLPIGALRVGLSLRCLKNFTVKRRLVVKLLRLFSSHLIVQRKISKIILLNLMEIGYIFHSGAMILGKNID